MQQARSEVVRSRVVDGAVALLRAGQPVTFKDVAREADVPERTIYRHFPTRRDLLAAVFDWANTQIGFDGPRPTTEAELVALVRRAFSGFDDLAPVVRQMLIEPDSLGARVADVAERRRAAIALVEHEAPGLDRTTTERVAAVVQILGLASTWQSLTQFWDLDGHDAGDTVALAIELLLEAARTRTAPPTT